MARAAPFTAAGRASERRIFVETARDCSVATATALLLACGGTLSVMRLQPEQPATLRVGQIAAVHVLSERNYSIGSAGTSLVLTQQTQQDDTTVYFYRAVRTGDQTLVATPRDPGPGQCISCVTAHYFVKVIE
jgi:hypothetical protein